MKFFKFFVICLCVLTLTSCKNKDNNENENQTPEEVNNLIISISGLPGNAFIDLDDEEKIMNLQNIYNSLSEENKVKVTNYSKLEGAINKINALKNEVASKYNDLVFQITELIYNLPSNVNISLENEEQVSQIRAKYDTLPVEYQNQVTNINMFLKCEEKINILKSINQQELESILDCVSDIALSDTEDNLLDATSFATIEWSSSNSKLYSISGNKGTVSKVFQKHVSQNVTVTATLFFGNSITHRISKEIVVQPVQYAKISNTPVATYFATSAFSYYAAYNERYKQNGSIFSDTTKEALDIVYYAFGIPDVNGRISLSSSLYVDEVNKLKEYNVRNVLSIHGVSGTTSKYFMDLCADDNKRAQFVNNIMNVVEQYNFDGVDIDWETVSDSICVVPASMNKLMQDLREEMDHRQERGGSPYLLTCAIPASTWGMNRFNLYTLNNYVDYVNVMSYDLHNTEKTTHVSPLYTSENDGGYGFGCVWGVNALVNKGLDQHKIIIGSAGYGKAYKVTGTVGSSQYGQLGISGTLTKISGIDGSFDSGTVFGNAIKTLLNTGEYKVYTEYNSSGKVVGSYLYNPNTNIFVTYDSKEAIVAKYEYAASLSGVGIMCWSYTEDTSDNVIDAIYEAMNK